MLKKYILPGFYAGIIIVMLVCCEEGSVNVFTLNQDIELGEQMDSMVNADFNVVSQSQYTEAYEHLHRIRDEIIDNNSDLLKYENEFDWQVKLIKDDTTLNAFATPGGYMYFYTAIIEYLDNEAQFAGVLAHEMAHCDKRHSTTTMTKVYGYSLLIDILLGDDSGDLVTIVADLALGLGALKFSRKHEYEADEFSVKYLSNTGYDPRGIKGFFEKLGSASKTAEFLRTHPSPDNRLEAIDEVWVEIGEPAGETFVSSYNDFKNSLP